MIERAPTFIYFVKPIAMDGPIKIGCSVEPKGRLVSLMSWCPFELEILATAPGGYAEEKRLHHKFAADHLRSEWFRTTNELLRFIDQVRTAGALPFELVGDRYGSLLGLPEILDRHGVSKEKFAERAGVLPACVHQWATYNSRSSVGRALSTLESFGIECSVAELYGAPTAGSA